MIADLVERDTVVGLGDGPGKAGAGGGHRLEAEMGQRFCAADVEGIGQHEAAALVQLLACGALVRCGDRHDLSPFSSVLLRGLDSGVMAAPPVLTAIANHAVTWRRKVRSSARM